VINLKDTKKILEGLLGTKLTEQEYRLLADDSTVQKYLSVVLQDNVEFQQYVQEKYRVEVATMPTQTQTQYQTKKTKRYPARNAANNSKIKIQRDYALNRTLRASEEMLEHLDDFDEVYNRIVPNHKKPRK
jgi:hypothetical protein